MTITNIKALQNFLTEDQIFEVLILFDGLRKMEACRLLQTYLHPKVRVTVLEAMKILQDVYKGWN